MTLTTPRKLETRRVHLVLSQTAVREPRVTRSEKEDRRLTQGGSGQGSNTDGFGLPVCRLVVGHAEDVLRNDCLISDCTTSSKHCDTFARSETYR
jgi:hypothetical protein